MKQVEGHPNLIRNQDGVILNTNENELTAAKARKAAWKKKQKEIEELKDDVSELKDMMKKILEKL